MKRYWKIFWKFRSVQLMRLLEYRADFWFWSFVSIMWSVFNFFFFSILVGISGQIGGWNIYEIYVLMSVFTMIDAFTWSIFYHNMQEYTKSIFEGNFSQLLLLPINTQFLVMTRTNSYNNVFRFLLGLILLFWSLTKIDHALTLLEITLFLIMFTISIFFIYFLWFSLSTLAFYTDKLDNINEFIPFFRRAWQLPSSIYQGSWAMLFVYILPIGAITSISASILVGKSNLAYSLYFSLFTLLLFIFSRWFFKVSIKRYIGVAN